MITYEGYRRYLANDETVLEQLARELDAILDPAKAYAIRSSASFEDEAQSSSAGQFKTALNIVGTQSVIQAIWSIWATANSDAVNEYLKRVGHPDEMLDMGIIIQEMVQAQAAGVAFSCNPVTGREEVVIEAVRGMGTALVQGGVTPLHWVNRWGHWIQKPDSDDIPLDVITAVAEQTRRLANKVAYDVDLEWAWDGDVIYWLQIRPITSIRKTRVYSNAISREMLPGMIKPLVWSINVPQTNGAWVDVISEIIGKNDIDPISLAKQFHYRAYFDMGTFGQIFESLGMPPDALDRMAGIRPATSEKTRFKPGPRMFRHVPRMLRFGVKMWMIQGRAQQMLSTAQKAWADIPITPSETLEEQALLLRLDDIRHIHRQVTYYNIVVPFLLRFYEAMLSKGVQRAGMDFATLNLVEGIEGFEAYDLPGRLVQLHATFCKLDAATQQHIQRCTYTEFQQLEVIAEFRAEVEAFLAQFGHLSDVVTDFSNVTWREQPEMILQMIADYPAPTAVTTSRTSFDDLPVKNLRRRYLRLFYQRARRFRLYREAFSAVYTQGLGLIRATVLALGDRFVARGMLKLPDDIFYLYEQEIRQHVAGDLAQGTPAEIVERRRAEMELSRDAELPTVIYGDQEPPLMPRSQRLLTGTPTSPGYYTGTAKIIRGIGEFRKLAAGDVLVIPYSDVAWTPLFARARAVVAESGGMLSHSSIIAREYGIPAVVSVEGALSLPDNATVTVNGYTGEIMLHEEKLL